MNVDAGAHERRAKTDTANLIEHVVDQRPNRAEAAQCILNLPC